MKNNRYQVLFTLLVILLIFSISGGSDGQGATKDSQRQPAGAAIKADSPKTRYLVPKLSDSEREAIRWICENRLFYLPPQLETNPGYYEEFAYTLATNLDAYYVYVGFLDIFPSSAHRPEIERRMARFRLYAAPSEPSKHFFAEQQLKDKFNWNGAQLREIWAQSVLRSQDPETKDVVYQGKTSMGNLMFDGHVSFLQNGVRIMAGTKVFFPITKEVTFAEKMEKEMRIGRKGSGGDRPASKKPPQKVWPETASVTMSGKLEVGYKMGGLGQRGFEMIQRVTLRSGTDEFVLRLFPGTKSDTATTDKPLYLVVDGVMGGIPVAASTDYDVEGLLLKRAVAESAVIENKNTTYPTKNVRDRMLDIDDSKSKDQRELAIKKLVSFIFSDTDAAPGEDSREARFRRVAQKALYEQILERELQENPKSEVVLVRKLRPSEIKQAQGSFSVKSDEREFNLSRVPDPSKSKAPRSSSSQPNIKRESVDTLPDVPIAPVEVKKKDIDTALETIKRNIMPEQKTSAPEAVSKGMEKTMPTLSPLASLPEKQKADGGGGVGLDSRMENYYALIWSRIKGSWTIPQGMMPKENVEVVIYTRILRDGTVAALDFEKRSGNRYFDESALRSVKKVIPFPPFPDGLRESSLEVGFRFRSSEFR